MFDLDQTGGAPLLNVFGGKITTYRRLAESALEKIGSYFDGLPGPWTKGVALPGGDFPVDGVSTLVSDLRAAHPFLTERWALRLVRAYGVDAGQIMGGAAHPGDLGIDFGGTLTEAEVIWLMDHEYATCAADVIWRRSKLGLRMEPAQVEILDSWMKARMGNTGAAE